MELSPADRNAITDLINLHGHLTDRGDFPAMAALFTTDVHYDISAYGGGVLIGLDAIRDAALALGAGNPVAHHVTNIVVTPTTTGEARALSKGLGVLADGTCGSVTYEDTIVLTADGWRISHRVVLPRRTPLS